MHAERNYFGTGGAPVRPRMDRDRSRGALVSLSSAVSVLGY